MVPLLIGPNLWDIGDQCFCETTAWRNGVPTEQTNATVVASKCNGLIAFDQEHIIVDVSSFNSEGNLGSVDILTDESPSEIDGLKIQFDCPRFAFELLCDCNVEFILIQFENFGE